MSIALKPNNVHFLCYFVLLRKTRDSLAISLSASQNNPRVMRFGILPFTGLRWKLSSGVLEDVLSASYTLSSREAKRLSTIRELFLNETRFSVGSIAKAIPKSPLKFNKLLY